MSAVTSCPKCAGRVTVPAGAEPSAWVRCPLCGAEYQLRQALDYQPPVLALIDEPAVPAQRRQPIWAAMATASAEGAANTVEGITMPAAAATSAITAAWQSPAQPAVNIAAVPSGEADVISFDDSLLLDEDTAEISLDQPAEAGGASIGSAAQAGAGDEDFFKMVSSEPDAEERQTADEAIEWTSDESQSAQRIEQSADIAAPSFAEEEFRLADEERESATFEPVERAGAPVGAPFGLPPRRRNKANPVVMTAGILGGGLLGLAIGYGILLWGFAKDPFRLAAYLPDSLLPAALKSSSNQSIARLPQIDPSSSADPSADSGAAPGANDPFPAFGGGDSPTDDSGKDAMPDDSSTAVDQGATAKSADAAAAADLDPFGTDTGKAEPRDAGKKTQADDPIGDLFRTDPSPPASAKGTAARDPAAASIDPSGADKAAGKTADTADDPLADPFGDSAKTQPKAAATKNESPAASDSTKDPFGASADSKSDPFGATARDAKSDPFAPPTETADPNQKAVTGAKDANAGGEGARATPSAAADTKSGTVVDAQKPSDPFGTGADTAAKADPLAQPNEVFGPTTDTNYSSDDLLAAVEAARKTNDAAISLPASATLDEKNRVNGPYYKNLSRVAETFTSLDRHEEGPSHDRVTTAAITAVLDAAPNQKQLEELGKLSGYWYQRDMGKGIVVGGIVKESKPHGRLVESVVETLGKPLKGEPQQITVVSPSPLTDDASRPVLVVGTIIKEPKKNLRGYDGDAEKVVWAAIAMDPTEPAANRAADGRHDAAKQPLRDIEK